jgi:hypothetical protein
MNDPLDQLLQEDRYLNDAGFTAQVMGALPKRRTRKWLRPVILSAAAVAGVGVTLWLLPSDNFVAANLVKLAQTRSWDAIPWAPVAVIALIAWGTTALVAHEK